jgi:choline dehydrogenase-like flavoprotein
MAALALVRRGIPVTHLESGRAVPRGLIVRALGTNLLRLVPPPTPSHHVAPGEPDAAWYQVLMPGGLSNYWTGAVPRFAPEDFLEGERLHEAYRWPVTYRDLVPYYEQAEGLLTISAGRRDVPGLPAGTAAYPVSLHPQWEYIARRAESHGQGVVPLPMADGPRWMVRQRGTAFNSYDRLVRRLARLPHYQLLLDAHATRLEWNGDKRKVDSVVYVDRATGGERRLRGAAVVVAAGPLASARLLLNSTSSDFPSGLGDTHGILGRFLHDHRESWTCIELGRSLPRLRRAAYLTRAPYRGSAPLLAASCTVGSADHRAVAKILARTPVRSKAFGVVTFGTMVPCPTNYVRLAPDTEDEFGVPLLEIQLCVDEAVDDTSGAARERLLEILDESGYRPKVRAVATKPPGASVHYGGTVRMHSSARYGMLNGWNRLHAVDNVVVADASSFTTGPEKHPTLTAMALASRACEKLADDLRGS